MTTPVNQIPSFIDKDIFIKDLNKGLNNLLYVRDLSLWYGDKQILKNVELNIRDKGITTLLGPSGCGKTTLLRTFNRLTDLYPNVKTQGSIFFELRDIVNDEIDVYQHRQKMGLVSQRPQLLPGSIADNIRYALNLKGVKNKSEVADKIEHYLKKVTLWAEVDSRLDAPASGLSIGQQQRLCLARGLSIEPRVILADEPTSALDPVSSRKIEELFTELSKEVAIVLVTHSMSQAKRISNLVAFMHDGEIAEKGKPEVIFENPSNEYFREFLQS